MVLGQGDRAGGGEAGGVEGGGGLGEMSQSYVMDG